MLREPKTVQAEEKPVFGSCCMKILNILYRPCYKNISLIVIFNKCLLSLTHCISNRLQKMFNIKKNIDYYEKDFVFDFVCNFVVFMWKNE